ncbi:hypothetical protein [Clostridium scatologenes]|uniref:Uncharacterized protein n=1 Tax=Clostridium scatologenes TaxID=1548 RepID=A0A0E3JMQ6_CLOSL|nr:hypothetical protein [Clostridium scatologenes]AKA68310.1 hypothetical protein CSCA_1185 [Clostridium scatologenes]
MNKQILISNVILKLDKLGIKYSLGQETDVSINCDFTNRIWKVGIENINYSAFVYFNEENETVFIWEMIKDNSSGFSFDCDTGTSFQSGTAIFRQVKTFPHDENGKYHEYILDLNDISKSFKEVAKENGWKFKRVIRKKKALYLQAG